MPDEQALREKAREAIRVGKIPITKPARIFGGPMVGGASCSVCDGPIGPREISLEIASYAPAGEKSEPLQRLRVAPEARRYHLHLRCLAAWEFERTKAPGVSV